MKTTNYLRIVWCMIFVGVSLLAGAAPNAACASQLELATLVAETIQAKQEVAVAVPPVAVVEAILPAQAAPELVGFEFKQVAIEDVIRVIGETSGRNIVLDPALKGKKIDLHLKQVTTDEALELLYSAYGLSSSNIGTILFIATRDKIKQGTTRAKVIELRNINIDDAKELISNLGNAVNLSKETNTLVLVGAPEDIAKAEKILKEVDVPQPQVVLEAKIIEVNDDALRDLGFDWSDQIALSVQEATLPATLPNVVAGQSGFLNLHKLGRNAAQFGVTLKMLEYENKAKVLSNPRITTMNNKEAEIFIGDKVPYTITTVTGGVATTEVRFVEPGIRLKITPSIVEDDFVVIKIEPEVSYIYSWRGANDQYPWIKAREATAFVRIKNNESFALGGLLSNEDKKNLYRVPIIGKVPLLGNLFSYERKTLYGTDLIITVTPTIILDKTQSKG